MDINEDQNLLLLIKSGDEKAFEILYNKYSRMLYAISYYYIKDTELAEDILQDIFLTFWEQRQTIEIHTSLSNYLYTMTKNRVLHTIKVKNKEVLEAYELEWQIQFLQDDALNREKRELKSEMLYRAIAELPKQKKDICLLKLRNDLTNQQIAEQLGISISSVKSHYFASLRFLRYYLRRVAYLLVFLFLIFILYHGE